MKYNFDEIVPRKHTDCLKYDNVMEIFGTEEILPMWIADMDFKTPDFIVNAIRKRLDHELLGYSYCCRRWKPAIRSWVSRRYGWEINDEEIGFVGGIVPAISFALQFLKNIDYFDSHCDVAGQYTTGLILDILLYPILFAIAASLFYGINYLCRKWYLYERYQEKKRR